MYTYRTVGELLPQTGVTEVQCDLAALGLRRDPTMSYRGHAVLRVARSEDGRYHVVVRGGTPWDIWLHVPASFRVPVGKTRSWGSP